VGDGEADACTVDDTEDETDLDGLGDGDLLVVEVIEPVGLGERVIEGDGLTEGVPNVTYDETHVLNALSSPYTP